MQHDVRRQAVIRKALYAAGAALCLTSAVGCAGDQDDGRPTAARPTVTSSAGVAADLPSQVGRALLPAIDATVRAHLGYGLSEANGGGQLQHVDPADWKVCFQKAGPLPDSVIFGVVRTKQSCPEHWTDKVH